MMINDEVLTGAVKSIGKTVDETFGKDTMCLGWLLVRENKAAVLIDRRVKDSGESDVMLFDLNGRLCFRHHNSDPYEECYFEVIGFFEREYSGSSEDIIIEDRQNIDSLIAENLRDLTSMYENEDKFVREVPIKEIRYVCTILKLNRLFGIPSDDIQDSFYLRFGVVDDNDKLVQYHDIEYIQDEECEHGYMYIDDFILDGQNK